MAWLRLFTQLGRNATFEKLGLGLRDEDIFEYPTMDYSC